MHKLFDTTLIICIVLMTIIMQETESQNCSNQHIESCTTAYYSTLRDSAGDIGAVCSVMNTYSECLQTLSDCNSTAVHEAIADANTTLYQSGCEIEAQNCSTKQILSCTTSYYNALREASRARNKEDICSVINTYMECLLTYSSHCNSNAVHWAIADANTSKYQSGCDNEGQNCSTKQIESCTNAYVNALRDSPRNKETMCSVTNTYMECLQTYSSHCNSNTVHEAIAYANMTLYQSGCDNETQICSTKQINCTTAFRNAVRELPQNKKTMCSLIRTYIECLQTYSSDCNSNAAQWTIANANTTFYQSGCENEALNCSTSQIGSCATVFRNALRDSPRTKEALCSVLTLHLECLETHFSDCNLEAGQVAIDDARMSLTLLECGNETQNCSAQHIESCAAAYYSKLTDSAGDKDAICRALTFHLDCLQTHFSDCNLEAGQEAIVNARMSLIYQDCDISDRPSSTSSDHLTTSLSAEEAEAQNCAFPKIRSCISALESVMYQAGEDKGKKCSAGYIYLECVTKVGTYCNLDVGRALINVNKMLSQYGCVNDSGNGAGSIFFTFFVMCYGLTLYQLV
ncbi:uncharacterized protein LOC143082130 [Mytilus galloprovincialis]|uniref:uncharacterized protein LOC143082130 n=1 Tax=Mytilus galloprovincialis TaxID=29158 RepID=UPI003F7BB255